MVKNNNKKKTRATKQTVEITTKVQTPISDDEFHPPKRQRPDEVELEMSDAENVSPELEGPSRSKMQRNSSVKVVTMVTGVTNKSVADTSQRSRKLCGTNA